MKKYIFGCMLLIGLGLAPVFAKPDFDTVLLLDTSASMLTTDPENHRMAAIRLFISLMEEEDRLALLRFDSSAEILSDFRFLDAAAKADFKRLLETKGQANGGFTNLRDPIAKALELLRRQRPNALPLVIMLTDGKMDLGDAAVDQRLTDELRNQVLPLYQHAGIKLYCIAFSEKSDFRLLQSLALPTGGEAWNGEHAETLKRLFTSLFLAVKHPETLPVQNGRFKVGENIPELTAAAENGEVRLESPSGKRYDADKGASVVRVQNPEAGEWSLKGDSDGGMVFVSRPTKQAPAAMVAPPSPLPAPMPPASPAPASESMSLSLEDPDVRLALHAMLWGNLALIIGGLAFIWFRRKSPHAPPD
jgi:hypothetical protein